MAEEPDPEAAVAALCSTQDSDAAQRTSDYYRVSQELPARFNHPGWFRGYRVKERNPLFRTTNMDYGAKAPTVHEMPTGFRISPHAFSNRLITFGMYRNYGINTTMEKSYVTGPDNFITFLDTLNFHPSYRLKGPSVSE
ncbi:piercer of microtubule wall 1 protein [Erythrolamprus reginae]|uniref:piercer of microtubule wall 1 protein n=1 Tax=Erythrolamprus reginae TaxID=121349 RepID=UPI00396C8B91